MTGRRPMPLRLDHLRQPILLSRGALLRLLAMLGGAVLLTAASPAPQKNVVPAVVHRGTNWTVAVKAPADGAHLIGNPDAKVKLTEYISYTCPHCAHFNRESEAALRMVFVGSGNGSIEVRPYIRNPVDLAASLLVNCTDQLHFLRLHDTFLNTQTEWMARVAAVGDAQRDRWEKGPMPDRMRAIAGDLDFYHIMENAGFDRVQTDRCLNDEAAMHRLAEQTAAADKAGVQGTPSFAIDGVVLTGTFDWKTLEPQLSARM